MRKSLVLLWLFLGAPAISVFAPIPVSFADAQEHSKILDDVLSNVKSLVASGTVPTVIFDLDDTLFDPGSRTLMIFKELSKTKDAKNALPDWETQLASVDYRSLKYEIKDNLKMFGIIGGEFEIKAKAFWSERFFSHEYCAFDRPNPGAVDYVNELYSSGADIVYLTGRSDPDMGIGTKISIRMQGLPIGERATVYLKPKRDMSDVAFKTKVFEEFNLTKKVIASFDNEPANVNAMLVAFPAASIVYLNTRHSSKPDVPADGIAWVRDFTRAPRASEK